ncbi:zinc finger protein 816-like [Culicoides brevitarsis]|uniref:zinc finger protein 816-like n=1 Tax=Culicoides brevitarsis TaxID=469753 RepID=UPI00307B5D09
MKRDVFLIRMMMNVMKIRQKTQKKVFSSPTQVTNDKKYQCSYCSRVLGNKFRLRNHMRIHTGERPFVCKTCNKAFAQPNALKCHLRLHTGEKPYKCPIESCGKSFRQNTTLKTHMAALHIGKSVKCDSCDKTFTRASYLTAHQRLEHFGERPYACHLCPKRYKQKSHLDHHLEVHQGVKYVCNVCNRSYSKKWSLQVHSYTHSQDPTKKLPHACSECDESFARKDKLRSHIRAKHENVKAESHVEVVPIASNVVEVESRPIILEMEPVMDGMKQFEARQYHVINIPEGTELIQEIVIPNEAIFY